MAIPSISAFIVNYNTRALLERCLRSIFNNKGDLSIEVFVVDNGSTDGGPEMVKTMFPQVSLTRYSENIGYTKAINPVLRFASGSYCLLLHSDIEVLPNTFKEFLDFFKSHPEAGILGGNLYYPDGTPNPCEILFPNFRNDLLCFGLRLLRKLPVGKKVAGDFNPLEWSHKSTSQVNWVWNACMMVRREILERVGYFDEDFFVWYADWDLCKRAGCAGWAVYYVHPATAIHYERQSFAGEGIINEDVRYKVDGWYSAPAMIQDRFTFLKKHSSPESVCGAKAISIVDNGLRVWLILANLLLGKTMHNEAQFQVKACFQTIQTILKA